MKKSITIISLNYFPEDTAIGLYSTQMAEFLVGHGWKVQVICGFPYYPEWKISKEYQERPSFIQEIINGVEVIRYKQFVPNNPSFKNRSLQIIDYTLGNLLNLRRIETTDIVFSVIPFTSSAWLGKSLSGWKNIPHWIHIQDFEFDAAFESGVSNSKKHGVIANTLFKLESRILNSAKVVSTISNGMMKKLKTKYTGTQYLFPNWVDENFINPKNANNHSYFYSDKFQILYSGNIGAKQDWDIFLNLVKLCEPDSSIEFIVVGDGGKRSDLEKSIENMKNVVLYNPVPYSELNDLLCSADLHLLFQKSEVIDTVMPSKILGMMCSATPSLVTGNMKSEVATVFKNSLGGEYLDGTSVSDLAEKIQSFKNNPNLCKVSGLNARNYVIKHFSKNEVLANFNLTLNQIIDEK